MSVAVGFPYLKSSPITLILIIFFTFYIKAQTVIPDKFPYPFPQALHPDMQFEVDENRNGTFNPSRQPTTTGIPGILNFLSGNAHRAAALPTLSPHPDDIYWDDRFTLPGVDGVVYCMAMNEQGELFIGGTFSTVGKLNTHHIAKWDGEQWQPLGEGVSGTWGNINPSVRAMLWDGNDLYAGGEFRYAGSQIAQNIARWDGSQWHTLGNDTCNGLGEYVIALAKIDSSLYVSGNFFQVCTPEGWISANGIARWDGYRWRAVGDSVNNGVGTGRIYAMEVIDTVLYAGGIIFEAGGQPMSHVITWDGYQWVPVGSGVNHTVYSMGVDENKNLYVGGTFTQAGGNPARYIAKWDGNNWSAVGSGGSGEGPNDGVITIFPDGDDLYIGGHFTQVSGDTMLHIARWDGESWSPLGSGLDQLSWLGPSPAVNCIVKGNDGLFYVGGGFVQAGEKAVNHLGIWDGREWSTITEGGGQGVNGPVRIIIADSEGNIYAGGWFTCAGEIAANHVARWDGQKWHPLGRGITPAGGTIVPVTSIAIADNEDIFVGGYFVKAGNVDADHIARWDGERWHILGDGPSNGINDGYVAAIGLKGEEVFAGGQFQHAGGVSAKNIAHWNGNDWLALGTGVGKDDETVQAITVFDNKIYAGGNFTEAGGDSAARLAVWDGVNWSEFAGGISYEPGVGLNHILFHNDNLYVSGLFLSVAGVDANSIAKWDGSNWFALGDSLNNGADGIIADFGFDQNTLFICGCFNMAGNDSASGVAMWDQNSWSALGSGVSGAILETLGSCAINLAISRNSVYVGGAFTKAGQKPSYCFGRWRISPTSVSTHKEILSEFVLKQNYPNPFNPLTNIQFEIPHNIDSKMPVQLKIYDLLGREIKTLVNKAMQPGEYMVQFDGSKLSSGIYYYRLTAGSNAAVKKMLLLR